jgi:hypothetical protein
MDDWYVMSRCNRAAKQLFGKNYREADSFARLAYQRRMIDCIPPEELRDRRAPSLGDKARLRKRKQLFASGFYTGTS